MAMSIRSVCADPYVTPAGLVELVAMGFSGLELSFNRPTKTPWDDRGFRADFMAAARQSSLLITAHAHEDLFLTNPDRVELDRHLSIMKERLESTILAYEPTAVVLHACGYNERDLPRGEQQFAALVHTLACLEPLCREAGARLCVETMCPRNTFTSSIAAIVEAVDAVSSPYVGVCVDTNHVNNAEHLPSAIRLLGSRIGVFHVNDNHGRGEEHLLPFDGLIDWEGFAQAAGTIGYRGAFVLESAGLDSDDEIRERLLASVRRLAGLLQPRTAAQYHSPTPDERGKPQ